MTDPTPPEPASPPPGPTDGGPQPDSGQASARSTRRYAHRRQPHWTWWRWLALALSLAAIVAALALVYNIESFYRISADAGRVLVHEEERIADTAKRQDLCATGSTASTTTSVVPHSLLTRGIPLAELPQQAATQGLPKPAALLEAPAIGLLAPVVEGTGGQQLAVAVGRVPASAQFGQPGTVVLAAHDVTWFSKIDQLHTGSTLSVVMACSTLTYQVTSQQVVPAGTPILQSSRSRLALVTCYPLNALFITSQRYLVFADLVATRSASAHVSAPSAGGVPTVAIPPRLAAQGLSLDDNPTPLGTLTLAGSVAPAWQQSSAPLDDQSSVLTLYFAAVHSGQWQQPTWWSAIAPTVPFSAATPLAGTTVDHYLSPLDTTLTVDGSTLTGAAASGELELVNGNQPGDYNVTMTASVVGGKLAITGWTMTPLTG